MSEQLAPDHIERIHELIVTTNTQLDNIGHYYTPAYGPALLALMTYVVEKTYASAPSVEQANAMFASAQEVGLQSWVDQEEAKRSKRSIVTLDDLDEEGV